MIGAMSPLAARFERAVAQAGGGAAGGAQAGGGGGPGAVAAFERLAARYGEPHRAYHTLAHVDACLGWLDWFAALAEDPAAVELALWYHDAVYDPRARDNEARSAELARAELGALGVPYDTLGAVERFILATADHRAGSGDAALVVDVDLAILGARAPVFAAFERAVRVEYAHVPEPAFRAGRRAVLASFLDRPRIYQVRELREELEGRARRNLERRVRELTEEA